MKRRLPTFLFENLNKIVPYVSCDVLLVNKRGEFLLTWREDRRWKGWHIPGSIVDEGEEFDDTIYRVMVSELGISTYSLGFLFPTSQTESKRGHNISLLWEARSGEAPRDGKWFSEIPRNIIEYHGEMIRRYLNER